jgi:ADP-ribose pyrophosphatase
MTDREPEAPWRTLESEIAFDGAPWIRVRRETVLTGAGKRIEDFYRVEASDFALVFTEDQEGRIVTLRQWRQGARAFGLSFPGGHVDAGETAEEAVLRELREETGWIGEEPEFLGRFVMHSNFGIGHGSFFRARGRRVGERSAHDAEAAEVRLVPRADLEAALTDGRIITVHDALCARLGLAQPSRATP